MRLILVALLFAISYAQTGNDGCAFSEEFTVKNGWSGDGFGREWCNKCACADGVLMCTLLDCETTSKTPTRDCTLSGGEYVRHGQSGRDTGENFCNECVCNDGKLMCTMMVCEIDNGDGPRVSPWVPVKTIPSEDNSPCETVIIPGPTPISEPDFTKMAESSNPQPTPMSETAQPIQEPLPIPEPTPISEPDFTKMDESTCGGKTQNVCHNLPFPVCIDDPCCHVIGTQCESVTKIVPAHFGLECGDYSLDAECQTDPACLWVDHECDELKEMECADLPRNHCWNAQMCSWVFDDLVEVCKETKEVEALHLIPIIPLNGRQLRNSHDKEQESSTEVKIHWGFFSIVGLVGIIFGCVLGSFLIRGFRNKSVELSEDLSLGMINRRV